MPDNRLRILMIAPTPYFADRGCHVRIYEEARALTLQGHDVRIITYHLGRDMPGIPVIRIPNIPWYHKLEAGPSLHKLYLDFMLFCTAALYIPQLRPDLIHAHLHEGAFIGYFLKKLARIPLVLDYQGSLTGECIDHGFIKLGTLTYKFFKRIEAIIHGFCDRIITSSTAGANELVKIWGIAPQSVSTLMDGVDTDYFKPHDKLESRKRLGIPADVPVVAYLGLTNRYQGTDLLLECIALLKSHGVRVHFLIMGFPEATYRTQTTDSGIDEMITFTGKISYAEAPFFLSAADIAVTPKLSKTEANGKIFNYMACGLPVICFDTPVNREILGNTGTYCRFADSADLATKISAVLENTEMRNSISENVRKMAIHEHSWASRTKKIEHVYREMLQNC